MNERIEKLASQAGGVHSHGYERGEPINRVIFSVAELQKFAELIGRDMLKLANRHENIKIHSINEYFGFEKDFGINTNNIKRFVNERTTF